MMKYSGFTLVELIITLAIAAILTTLAVPSFNETIKNNRLATQTNLLVGSLGLARSEAVKRGRSVNVCSSSNNGASCANNNNWSQGWLIWIDLNANGTVQNGEQIHSTEARQAGLTITGSAGQVTYTPQGSESTLGIETFGLCDDRTNETGRTITIGNTGRANLSDKNDCS